MKNSIHSRMSHFVMGFFVLVSIGFWDAGYVGFHKSNAESNNWDYIIIVNPETAEFLSVKEGVVSFEPGPLVGINQIWIYENLRLISLNNGQYLTAQENGNVILEREKSDSNDQLWHLDNDQFQSLFSSHLFKYLFDNNGILSLKEEAFALKSWPMKLIKIVAAKGSDPSLLKDVFVDLKTETFGIPFRTEERYFGDENYIYMYVPYDPEYAWNWKLSAEEDLGKADGLGYKYIRDIKVGQDTEVIFLEINWSRGNW
jgi:hypothetical protein